LSPVHIAWANAQGDRNIVATIQHVSGDPGGNQVNYPGAFGAGIDLLYEVDSDALKKTVVVESRGLLGNPSAQVLAGTNVRLQVVFEITTNAGRFFAGDSQWDGETEREEIPRGELRDAVLNYSRIALAEPKYWDSDFYGSEQLGRYRFKKIGASRYVIVEVPGQWANTATFPVYIDPTTKFGAGTSADAGYQNVLYNRSIREVNDTGSDVWRHNEYGSTYDWGCMCSVDLTSFTASATITAARMYAYYYTTSTGSTYKNPVYQVREARAFTTAATFTTYNGTNTWGAPGGTNVTTDRYPTYLAGLPSPSLGDQTATPANWTWYYFDGNSSFISAAQAKVAVGKFQFHGILSGASGPDYYWAQGWTSSSSQRPYLQLWYTLPASSNPVAMML
jgi:hypothetical protein